MGDTPIIKKEETLSDDTFSQFFKKEEDVEPKAEPLEMIETSNYELSHHNPMTIPWIHTAKYSTDASFSLHLQESLYCDHKWIRKPFKIIKHQEDRSYLLSMRIAMPFEETREPISIIIRRKPRKKIARTSAVKNYVGLICTGLSRAVLTADIGSEMLTNVLQIVHQKKLKYLSLERIEDEDLLQSLKIEMYEKMCGKKVKRSHCDRDFKIRSTAELDSLLAIKSGDDELTTMKKEVLREVLNYFFTSEYYDKWLSNGMVSETNRLFLKNNRKELHKKFLNPAFYKPKFSYDYDIELESEL